MNTPRDAITLETFQALPLPLQAALIAMSIIIAALVTLAIRQELRPPQVKEFHVEDLGTNDFS